MLNDASINLIKKWEGFRAKAYQDSVGVWTIGYGTTVNAGVGIDPREGMCITEAQALGYLNATVTKFAANVSKSLTALANENEFGAMVSLAYNIGPTAFKRSSVLRLFNSGDKKEAADAFLLWNKAGGKVLKGLNNRRADERLLFLTPVKSFAPSAPLPKPPGNSWLAVIIAVILRMFGGKK
jgi:lysozyme